MEFILFVIVSVGIIIIPGPNVLVIISTSVLHGKMRGLQTVVGTSSAMAIQLVLAAVCTNYFVSIITKGFVWLKWFGVAYLIFLGIKHIKLAFVKNQPSEKSTAIGSFRRGFLASLTNPKTILFFSAFLPQFVVQSSSYISQVALLSLIFWLLALLSDSCYAILSSKLAQLLRTKNLETFQNALSGAIYSFAGILLASIKKA